MHKHSDKICRRNRDLSPLEDDQPSSAKQCSDGVCILISKIGIENTYKNMNVK